MVFKIGNTDFSGHVIAGSYAINKEAEYVTWTDAAHKTHKLRKRYRVKGTCDMFFRTIAEYSAFQSAIAAATAANNDSINMTVTVNKTTEDKTIEAYLDYLPVRNRDGNWNDYFERFTLSVEER